MIDCSAVNAGTSVSLVQQCDIVGNGALRMLTPFRYPNGAQIDLFPEEREPLLGTFILSGLGQTTSYLLDLQVKPWVSNKRRQIIEDVCRSLDVHWRGGRFQIELEDSDVAQTVPVHDAPRAGMHSSFRPFLSAGHPDAPILAR